MTEDEYVNATNLAKLKSAKFVLNDFHPMDEIEEKELIVAMRAIINLTSKLEKIVCIDPESGNG